MAMQQQLTRDQVDQLSLKLHAHYTNREGIYHQWYQPYCPTLPSHLTLIMMAKNVIKLVLEPQYLYSLISEGAITQFNDVLYSYRYLNGNSLPFTQEGFVPLPTYYFSYLQILSQLQSAMINAEDVVAKCNKFELGLHLCTFKSPQQIKEMIVWLHELALKLDDSDFVRPIATAIEQFKALNKTVHYAPTLPNTKILQNAPVELSLTKTIKSIIAQHHTKPVFNGYSIEANVMDDLQELGSVSHGDIIQDLYTKEEIVTHFQPNNGPHAGNDNVSTYYADTNSLFQEIIKRTVEDNGQEGSERTYLAYPYFYDKLLQERQSPEVFFSVNDRSIYEQILLLTVKHLNDALFFRACFQDFISDNLSTVEYDNACAFTLDSQILSVFPFTSYKDQFAKKQREFDSTEDGEAENTLKNSKTNIAERCLIAYQRCVIYQTDYPQQATPNAPLLEPLVSQPHNKPYGNPFYPTDYLAMCALPSDPTTTTTAPRNNNDCVLKRPLGAYYFPMNHSLHNLLFSNNFLLLTYPQAQVLLTIQLLWEDAQRSILSQPIATGEQHEQAQVRYQQELEYYTQLLNAACYKQFPTGNLLDEAENDKLPPNAQLFYNSYNTTMSTNFMYMPHSFLQYVLIEHGHWEVFLNIYRDLYDQILALPLPMSLVAPEHRHSGPTPPLTPPYIPPQIKEAPNNYNDFCNANPGQYYNYELPSGKEEEYGPDMVFNKPLTDTFYPIPYHPLRRVNIISVIFTLFKVEVSRMINQFYPNYPHITPNSPVIDLTIYKFLSVARDNMFAIEFFGLISFYVNQYELQLRYINANINKFFIENIYYPDGSFTIERLDKNDLITLPRNGRISRVKKIGNTSMVDDSTENIRTQDTVMNKEENVDTDNANVMNDAQGNVRGSYGYDQDYTDMTDAAPAKDANTEQDDIKQNQDHEREQPQQHNNDSDDENNQNNDPEEEQHTHQHVVCLKSSTTQCTLSEEALQLLQNEYKYLQLFHDSPRQGDLIQQHEVRSDINGNNNPDFNSMTSYWSNRHQYAAGSGKVNPNSVSGSSRGGSSKNDKIDKDNAPTAESWVGKYILPSETFRTNIYSHWLLYLTELEPLLATTILKYYARVGILRPFDFVLHESDCNKEKSRETDTVLINPLRHYNILQRFDDMDQNGEVSFTIDRNDDSYVLPHNYYTHFEQIFKFVINSKNVFLFFPVMYYMSVRYTPVAINQYFDINPDRNSSSNAMAHYFGDQHKLVLAQNVNNMMITLLLNTSQVVLMPPSSSYGHSLSNQTKEIYKIEFETFFYSFWPHLTKHLQQNVLITMLLLESANKRFFTINEYIIPYIKTSINTISYTTPNVVRLCQEGNTNHPSSFLFYHFMFNINYLGEKSVIYDGYAQDLSSANDRQELVKQNAKQQRKRSVRCIPNPKFTLYDLYTFTANAVMLEKELGHPPINPIIPIKSPIFESQQHDDNIISFYHAFGYIIPSFYDNHSNYLINEVNNPNYLSPIPRRCQPVVTMSLIFYIFYLFNHNNTLLNKIIAIHHRNVSARNTTPPTSHTAMKIPIIEQLYTIFQNYILYYTKDLNIDKINTWLPFFTWLLHSVMPYLSLYDVFTSPLLYTPRPSIHQSSQSNTQSSRGGDNVTGGGNCSGGELTAILRNYNTNRVEPRDGQMKSTLSQFLEKVFHTSFESFMRPLHFNQPISYTYLFREQYPNLQSSHPHATEDLYNMVTERVNYISNTAQGSWWKNLLPETSNNIKIILSYPVHSVTLLMLLSSIFDLGDFWSKRGVHHADVFNIHSDILILLHAQIRSSLLPAGAMMTLPSSKGQQNVVVNTSTIASPSLMLILNNNHVINNQILSNGIGSYPLYTFGNHPVSQSKQYNNAIYNNCGNNSILQNKYYDNSCKFFLSLQLIKYFGFNIKFIVPNQSIPYQSRVLSKEFRDDPDSGNATVFTSANSQKQVEFHPYYQTKRTFIQELSYPCLTFYELPFEIQHRDIFDNVLVSPILHISRQQQQSQSFVSSSASSSAVAALQDYIRVQNERVSIHNNSIKPELFGLYALLWLNYAHHLDMNPNNDDHPYCSTTMQYSAPKHYAQFSSSRHTLFNDHMDRIDFDALLQRSSPSTIDNLSNEQREAQRDKIDYYTSQEYHDKVHAYFTAKDLPSERPRFVATRAMVLYLQLQINNFYKYLHLNNIDIRTLQTTSSLFRAYFIITALQQTITPSHEPYYNPEYNPLEQFLLTNTTQYKFFEDVDVSKWVPWCAVTMRGPWDRITPQEFAFVMHSHAPDPELTKFFSYELPPGSTKSPEEHDEIINMMYSPEVIPSPTAPVNTGVPQNIMMSVKSGMLSANTNVSNNPTNAMQSQSMLIDNINKPPRRQIDQNISMGSGMLPQDNFHDVHSHHHHNTNNTNTNNQRAGRDYSHNQAPLHHRDGMQGDGGDMMHAPRDHHRENRDRDNRDRDRRRDGGMSNRGSDGRGNIGGSNVGSRHHNDRSDTRDNMGNVPLIRGPERPGRGDQRMDMIHGDGREGRIGRSDGRDPRDRDPGRERDHGRDRRDGRDLDRERDRGYNTYQQRRH